MRGGRDADWGIQTSCVYVVYAYVIPPLVTVKMLVSLEESTIRRGNMGCG